MVFKRRDKRPVWKIVSQTVWPRGGWARAARYVQHRVNRLPDTPEKIARGVFAGVFTTFSPFYGLHFFISAALAVILRGNVIAALLGTFFGNPLTYLPIGVISMTTGYWMLGIRTDPADHTSLGGKFMDAGDDLWANFVALFTPAHPQWEGLALFYDQVFYPYLVGGIVPGIVCGLVAYYITVPIIRAYQNRRRGVLAAKLAALKAKKPGRKSEDHG
ncbi:hypothetical protein ATO8_13757 [Roseivivax marinus]|uniref:DUF2062 domain-containing protein n=1 Tax=Roseivivax marinus TaxID=1379903 RepID=W4HJJ1_9RHOB|nr:DUF2062 domain-containing protein [Roseivivax marinus]ETW12165.1 hypothetical protein ATO8_13757 [Roseivivax marinus]UMA64811.1 DUF2062 domain-containing protein [Roseivivax marinus]SEL25271.1 hypothetical protein SAMN05444413_10786 [Roseivivax marinus]